MTARAGGLQHNRAQTSAAQQAMGGRTGVLLQEEALGLTGAALAGKYAILPVAAGEHCVGGCIQRVPLKPNASVDLSSYWSLQGCSIVQLSCLPAATEARLDPACSCCRLACDPLRGNIT